MEEENQSAQIIKQLPKFVIVLNCGLAFIQDDGISENISDVYLLYKYPDNIISITKLT